MHQAFTVNISNATPNSTLLELKASYAVCSEEQYVTFPLVPATWMADNLFRSSICVQKNIKM